MREQGDRAIDTDEIQSLGYASNTDISPYWKT